MSTRYAGADYQGFLVDLNDRGCYKVSRPTGQFVGVYETLSEAYDRIDAEV